MKVIKSFNGLWWSEDKGWTTLDEATVYVTNLTLPLNLPLAESGVVAPLYLCVEFSNALYYSRMLGQVIATVETVEKAREVETEEVNHGND